MSVASTIIVVLLFLLTSAFIFGFFQIKKPFKISKIEPLKLKSWELESELKALPPRGVYVTERILKSRRAVTRIFFILLFFSLIQGVLLYIWQTENLWSLISSTFAIISFFVLLSFFNIQRKIDRDSKLLRHGTPLGARISSRQVFSFRGARSFLYRVIFFYNDVSYSVAVDASGLPFEKVSFVEGDEVTVLIDPTNPLIMNIYKFMCVQPSKCQLKTEPSKGSV
jgi:hypothetical protein